MQEMQIQDYARQLFDARGQKAIAQAAQKARTLEEKGQADDARTWRHIEAALRSMAGPKQA